MEFIYGSSISYDGLDLFDFCFQTYFSNKNLKTNQNKPWELMGTHGNTLGTHGNTRGTHMGIPWGPMGIPGEPMRIPWGPMGIPRDPWEYPGTQGIP